MSPARGSASVSLTPTNIIATNHVVAGTAVTPIPQPSVAIVNTQSSAAVSYHPQVRQLRR